MMSSRGTWSTTVIVNHLALLEPHPSIVGPIQCNSLQAKVQLVFPKASSIVTAKQDAVWQSSIDFP